jgi:hypothetical protein
MKQIFSLLSHLSIHANYRVIDAPLQSLTLLKLRYATDALASLHDAIASPT